MSSSQPNRNYKFMLAESDDMTPVGWIKSAREKKLDLALNKSGSASFRVPLTDSMAYEIIGQEVVRCVKVYCDDANGNPTIRWSGPIWTTTVSVPSESIIVNCVGWKELLDHRELRVESIFDNLDAGEIASRLITDANHTTYLTNLLSNWSFEADAYGYTNTGYSSVARSNSWSTTGGYSEQLVAPVGTNTLDSGYVAISDSTEYTSCIDLNVDATGTKSIRLDLLWYDASKVFISTSSSSSTTSSGEQSLSVTATSPVGSAYVRLRIRCATSSGTATFYVDSGVIAAGSSTGITPTPISIGDVTVSQTRDITFAQGTKHGAAIDSLVNMEAGFDWDIDPETREFSVLYDNVKGTIYGKGVDNVATQFSYAWGPKNVASVTVSTDSSNIANRVNVKGTYTTAIAYDSDSIASYGLFEDTLTVSDVVDDEILLAYAGAETAYRLQPFNTYSFQPFPYDGTEKIPLFFDDYDIGDIVYLTAKYGALNIERQAVRVFGVSIDIDNEGNEKIGEIKTVAS